MCGDRLLGHSASGNNSPRELGMQATGTVVDTGDIAVVQDVMREEAEYRPIDGAALATELEVAQQQLRLPKLLAQYRRYALILVDEVGYLPFSQMAAELLFQFFSL
jgi:IstB-like ATP binding protein